MDEEVRQDPQFRFRFIAQVVREEDRVRLIEKHGFSRVGSSAIYLQKELMATYSDAVAYAGSLRGVPGIVHIRMHLIEDDIEPADVGVKQGT